MKNTAWSILLIALVALAFCSKGAKSKDGSPTPPPPALHEINESRPAPATPEPDPLALAAVVLSPEAPTALDDILAAAELADPEVEGAEIRYQWYVNGQEVEELDGEKLASAHFRKGAWIYCRAKAFSAKGESSWLKSDTIRVLNSLPTLRLEPLGDVSVPGDLLYRATASDPDHDELTFELLSPLEQGIAIDARTGALSWHLSEETVRKLGEKIEIRIAVSDGEGEKVTGTITLQFTSTRK